MTKPRVRFAPSPTGALHLGSARTALYNYLFARQTGAEFVVRIEDTDSERSTAESVDQIWRTLDWLGIPHDDPSTALHQSTRTDRYNEVILDLTARGILYPCAESLEADATSKAMRLKIGDTGTIEFEDLIRGHMTFNRADVRDPLVTKRDGSAKYNLACAIDDMDMEITHVIRGRDHLNNTPSQITIITALGGVAPTYAHLPMLLGADGKKLSKRNGDASVEDHMEYLPETILHYLTLLGTGEGIADDRPCTLEELVDAFDFKHVSHSDGIFNYKMLDHLQGLHIRALTKEEWVEKYTGSDDPETAYDVAGQKMLFWSDVDRLMRPLHDPLVVDEDAHVTAVDSTVLASAHRHLDALTHWDRDTIGAALKDMCAEMDVKPRKAIPVVQRAIMGQKFGASLFTIAEHLGKEKTLMRIDGALNSVLNHMETTI